MATKISKSFAYLATFIWVLVAAGCSEDKPTGPESHPEVELVRLQVGGTALASATAAQSFNGIEILKNNKGTLDIVFVDPIGNPLIHSTDESLSIAIADTSVVTSEPGGAGAFSVSFTGLNVGSTTVVFSLMHGSGSEAHTDFVSAPIPFNITP